MSSNSQASIETKLKNSKIVFSIGKVAFTGIDANSAISVLALPELSVVGEGNTLSSLSGINSLGSVTEVGLIPPPPMFSNDTSPAPSPTLPLRIAQLTSSLNLRFSQMQQQQLQAGGPRESPTTGGPGPPVSSSSAPLLNQQQQQQQQLSNGSANGEFK